MTGLVGLASDVWALGCMLLQLLSGTRPWQARLKHKASRDDRFLALRVLLLEQGLTPLSEHPGGTAAMFSGFENEPGLELVQQPLAQLLARCFSKAAAQRPTASEVHSELEKLQKLCPADPLRVLRACLSQGATPSREELEATLREIMPEQDAAGAALEKQHDAAAASRRAELQREQGDPVEAALDKIRNELLERRVHHKQERTQHTRGEQKSPPAGGRGGWSQRARVGQTASPAVGLPAGDSKQRQGRQRRAQQQAQQGKDDELAVGRVKLWKADRGYGFIWQIDGKGQAEAYVSARELPRGVLALRRGQRVRFRMRIFGDGKVCASDVTLE